MRVVNRIAVVAAGTAVVLLLTLLLTFTNVGGDLSSWLALAGMGILVPVWAAWLGLRFDVSDASPRPPA